MKNKIIQLIYKLLYYTKQLFYYLNMQFFLDFYLRKYI